MFIEHLLVLGLVEAVGQAALPAVVTVEVARHEHAGAALVSRTLAPQPVDFTVLVHLEEEHVLVEPKSQRSSLKTG